MKDSQPSEAILKTSSKYIKANNERFSTLKCRMITPGLSISRRIMKDSQQWMADMTDKSKYIKANNERFSTFTLRFARCI